MVCAAGVSGVFTVDVSGVVYRRLSLPNTVVPTGMVSWPVHVSLLVFDIHAGYVGNVQPRSYQDDGSGAEAPAAPNGRFTTDSVLTPRLVGA